MYTRSTWPKRSSATARVDTILGILYGSNAYRHEGDECPRCDGSGLRARVRCAGCGVAAGRPSEGRERLMGLRNRRGKGQPMYCGDCHPELGAGVPGAAAMLEGIEA